MRTVRLLCVVVLFLWMAVNLDSSQVRAFVGGQVIRSTAQRTAGNGSLALDGAGDYIAIPHAPEFVPSGGITIEAWVRRAAVNRCETVVGKNWPRGYWLGFCTTTGKIRFYTHGIGTARDGNGTVPAGQWTHIAVTFDGTTRRYYINGYLDYEAETPGPLPFNTDELRIGADLDLFGNTAFEFQGNIAEVRIWDYARAQWEIRRDMHRKITEPVEGLVGVWHLQENAEEGFGRHTAILRGNAGFGGPPAPAYDTGPILIPRLSSTPRVDGVCGLDEYGDKLWFTVWNDDPREGYRGYRPVLYLGATATDIYACVNGVPKESTPQGLYFDGNNDGGETADGDDYRILLRTDDGAVTIQRGDGAGDYVQAALNAEAKQGQGVEFGPWAAEYRISRSEVTSPDGRFRLQFLRRFSLLNIWYDMGWPDNAHPTRPDVWPVFMVNDADIPPSDSRPPRVRLTLLPGEEISRGTRLSIRAEADDDVDLASITVSYPGGERTCTFTGSDDRTAVCEVSLDTSGLRLGWHAVYARAVDHRMAVGHSGAATFFVLAGTGDGQPPRVLVRYQYQNGTMYDDEDDELPDKHDVTFYATASDPDGIRRVDIEVRFDAPLPGSGRQELRLPCYGGGGEVRTEISCQNREVINIGMIVGSSQFVVARYRAIAEDWSGERKETPWQYLVLTERLPDSDNDDLPNAVESRIGTHPGDPDTDRDTLIDGLEVLGMTPAGYVELPSLGADPLRKDVFLQIDYEQGLGYSQADLDYFRNNLRRRGITLHIEQNERPPQTFDGTPDCGEDWLFSIADSVSGFVSQLDAGQISNALRNRFANAGWTLRSDARVFVVRTGSFWIIRSGDEQFPVRLRGNLLDILREDWLFSITDSVDGFVDELDRKQISDALRNRFADAERPLGSDARVFVIRKGSFWVVRSGDEQFLVRLRGNRLDILRGLSKVDIGAVEAAALRDAEGDYYFPPARNWTHLYVYVRYFDGRSGNWNRYGTIDGCWPDRQYRLIHEVGHALGLGHGGRSGPDAPQPTERPQKYLLYYRGGWINAEWKPNYRSIMSYRYDSLLYFNPSVQRFYGELDYNDIPLPTLNENALDERATSPFATQLRALPAPRDHVAVITYECVDSDERDDKGPFRYQVATDGQRMVGRKRLARDSSERDGAWQFSGLPAQASAGIDWNCDGSIDTRVSADIDGNRATRDEPMLARADYPFIPAGHPCNVLVRRDGSYPQPEGYRRAIQGLQCGAAAARSSVENQPTSDDVLTPHVDTNPPLELPPNTELCDGRDNDGDGQIDEGCPDSDKDEVVDAIDNCPQTPDATQADRDGDGIGDVCQYPAIDNLWVEKLTDTEVTLAWKGTDRDIGGYRIYRRRFDEPNYRYLATVTDATQYTDPLSDGSIYLYEVSVLNLNGVETDRATVATGTVRRVYIPRVVK